MGPLVPDSGELSERQKRIADYFERNSARVPYLTVDEIAAELSVSTATVSRFVRAAGYPSLKTLKSLLRDRLEASPSRKLEGRLDHMSGGNILGELISTEISHLRETFDRLDRNQFARAVGALAETQRLFLFGNGPNRSLVELLRFRMNRFGYEISEVGRANDRMAESLVHITERDCIVAFAFFRENPTTRAALRFARERGATVILITDLVVADIVSDADAVLYTARGASSEFHSLVPPVAVVDALVLGVASKRRRESVDKLEALASVRSRLAELET